MTHPIAPPVTPARARELLLIDDHTIVREGVRRILESAPGTWHVTEAGTGFQALEHLRTRQFELAIVDLSMPGISGLDLVHRFKIECPSMAVLVLSMHAEEQYALRAFKAGANGYLTKDSAAAELIAAVQKILSGGAYVTASLAERVVRQISGTWPAAAHAQLSDRELDVLRRIVAGERLTDIGQSLHLSIKTVSSHKTRIQQKLGLPSTAALIRYGLEHGLGSESEALGGDER